MSDMKSCSIKCTKSKGIKKICCQKWDSNPRPQKWTATWTQRLRPLGHPDTVRMEQIMAKNWDSIHFSTWKKSHGGSGYRSRYLSHAKRALYHLSYAPVVIVGHWSALVITWVTPSPGSDRHWSPGLNVKRALLLFPLFVSTCTEPVPPCLYHLR